MQCVLLLGVKVAAITCEFSCAVCAATRFLKRLDLQARMLLQCVLGGV